MRPAIEFTDEASAELADAIEGLWRLSPAAAKRFADDYDGRVAQILRFPKSGRRESPNQYSMLVRRFGYRIVYQFAENRVLITGLRNMRRG